MKKKNEKNIYLRNGGKNYFSKIDFNRSHEQQLSNGYDGGNSMILLRLNRLLHVFMDDVRRTFRHKQFNCQHVPVLMHFCDAYIYADLHFGDQLFYLIMNRNKRKIQVAIEKFKKEKYKVEDDLKRRLSGCSTLSLRKKYWRERV
jgi:hypothetical protein